jgi:hypothetical protein
MYPNNKSEGYTYRNAGFNGFLQRSIASDPGAASLGQMKRSASTMNSMNFDQMSISGNMADIIEVGRILINGAAGAGYIAGRDESGNQVYRDGDLEA